MRSSKHPSAGHLAGKTLPRPRKIANLLGNFLRFESSPGYQIFFIYQNIMTLFEADSRAEMGLNFCADYR